MNIEKYTNLEDVFPSLSGVLKDAIQSGTLEVRAVDKMCSKFLKASETHPELLTAEFVVYSPFVRKEDHQFEHFVFLDLKGKNICSISGTEMELYGLLEPCTHLKKSALFERYRSE